MKTLRTTLLTGLAFLSLGGAMPGAQAQSQSPNQAQAQASEHGRKAAPTREERQARHAEFEARRAQRIAKLHDELRITPAQESAWSAFVASMKPAQHNGGEHGGRQHGDRAAWAGLTAPQRAEKMLAMQKERTAAMEQRVAALNSFYSVLSPEQKKVFDEKTARMQERFGHHRGMHGEGQRRGGDAGRG
jgi:Spy/CpxP family protein refolding chaperone